VLPTVASGGRAVEEPRSSRSRRVPAAVVQLDEVLFLPSGWFALSAGNQRVPGVVVPSLSAGLGLVGQGDVASLVGRLRPGFRVVDVDVEGLRGQVIADEVTAWCQSRGLWCLQRPSGGAVGRTHVFVAIGEDLDALSECVAGLRAAYGVARAAIDVRELVRPLSAPHRTGVETRPLGSVQAALADLRRRVVIDTAAAGSRRARASTAPGVVLVPRPRPRRELPSPWQAFLATGVRPDLGQHEPDRAGMDWSRSTFEAIATATMLRAGWNVEEAWAAIVGAHPEAMDHARADRGRWVRHVWNRAVEDDNTRPLPAPRVDPAVWAAVQAAEARLRAAAWSVPPRRRVTLLRVGHAVLDRIIRTNAVRVPVPERDLVLDTGISDRATVRRALRWLHDRVVGVLDVEAFDPRQPRSSSFEFEIPPAAVGEGGVPQIPPPSSHTPLPRMLLGLSGTAWLLMRVLAQNLGQWWDLADLTVQCQLDEAAGVPIGGKRLRGVRTVLAELAQHGLARCDADGRWAASDIPASDVRERDVSWDGLVMQIQSERDAYRNGGQSRWQVARAASIKRERAKQRAWWDGLDPAEQAARHATWAARFDRLSVEDQFQVKADLARRSEVEGISPAARHQRWIYSMDPDDLVMFASERAVRFASIPLPRQVAAVRAWEAYRREFGVPRGSWQIGDRRRDRSDVADDALDWSSVGGR